jgi:hypothetical protein
MENTLNIIDDFDISANVFQPFDISNCILPPDLERCETIREYFYYTGYTGPTGPTGMTGPRGISKQENTFMTVYNTTLQQILPNSPVVFETNNCCYGSCFHSPNTSQIYIWRTGYYSIYINLFHLESSQFSLYKNGIIVPGTAIGSLSGSTQLSNSFILCIQDSDMTTQTPHSPTGYACAIELFNNTLYYPYITLYDASSIGFSTPQINANITISFLSD